MGGKTHVSDCKEGTVKEEQDSQQSEDEAGCRQADANLWKGARRWSTHDGISRNASDLQSNRHKPSVGMKGQYMKHPTVPSGHVIRGKLRPMNGFVRTSGLARSLSSNICDSGPLWSLVEGKRAQVILLSSEESASFKLGQPRNKGLGPEPVPCQAFEAATCGGASLFGQEGCPVGGSSKIFNPISRAGGVGAPTLGVPCNCIHLCRRAILSSLAFLVNLSLLPEKCSFQIPTLGPLLSRLSWKQKTENEFLLH